MLELTTLTIASLVAGFANAIAGTLARGSRSAVAPGSSGWSSSRSSPR
jgi:hypothetical protein